MRMRRGNRIGRSQTLGHVRITHGVGGRDKVCEGLPLASRTGEWVPGGWAGVLADEAAGNRHPLQKAVRPGVWSLLLAGPEAPGSRQEDKLCLLSRVCVCVHMCLILT